MAHKTSPAYQEYASALLANRKYREMSLAAKGLLHHIRLECWENGDVPKDHERLSRIIGCNKQEVVQLINECMPFLAIVGDSLITPALEDYRERLLRVSSARAKAGKSGGKSKANATNLSKQNSGTVNQTKPNQTNAVNGGSVDRVKWVDVGDWVADYTAAEVAQ